MLLLWISACQGKNGVEATQEITELFPDVKVIMLTSYADEDVLFDPSAEHFGYVLKQIGSDDLVKALERVGHSRACWTRGDTEGILAAVAPDRAKPKTLPLAALTARNAHSALIRT